MVRRDMARAERRQTNRPAAPTGGNAYRRTLQSLCGAFVAAAAFSALINVLMLTGSLYMLQVYDRVLTSGSVATLQGLLVIVTIAYAFYGFYEFLRSRILSRAAMRLNEEVGPATFRAWLRPGTGDRTQTLPLRDLELVRSFLSGPAMGGIFDVPWMPLYLGILFLIHPLLGWLTVAGAGLGLVVTLVNHALTKGTTERAMLGEVQSRTFADQGLRQAELIEAMGMQADVTRHWRDLQGAGLVIGQAASDVTEVTSAFSKAFRMFLQSAILTLGAWLVLQHEMSGGMIIACSVLSGRALAPADQIVAQWRAIAKVRVAHRRLSAFFENERVEYPPVRLPAPTGRIVVKGLTRLGAEVEIGERQRILQQVSFDLAPGEGLGVIGDSASGKSTLARILVGAWAADAGEVRLDGATRAQWDPVELGRHIGYLPQTVEMLPGTVRDNISRFAASVRDADVIEAAEMAGVHDMILGLPDGYRTFLGTGVTPLSGGQMQRLGLARALYGNPRIVVLDEPNANLDAHGETALAEALATLKERGSTVVLITHRVSVLASMDKILILNQGRVARYDTSGTILGGLGGDSVPDGSKVRPLRQGNMVSVGSQAGDAATEINALNAMRRRMRRTRQAGPEIAEGEAV